MSTFRLCDLYNLYPCYHENQIKNIPGGEQSDSCAIDYMIRLRWRDFDTFALKVKRKLEREREKKQQIKFHQNLRTIPFTMERC